MIPWYAGKVEIARYLADLNRDRKVIQYTLFQIGGFMNYLGHPHQTSTHVATLPLQFDFEKQRAVLLEGSLDDVVVWTTVQDVAGAVAGAVEYGGEWPAVGGVAGSRVTVREMLVLGEAIGMFVCLLVCLFSLCRSLTLQYLPCLPTYLPTYLPIYQPKQQQQRFR